LHSRQYFQCALLLQHIEIAAKVCFRRGNFPALSGIISVKRSDARWGNGTFPRERSQRPPWFCAAALNQEWCALHHCRKRRDARRTFRRRSILFKHMARLSQRWG
jgi:hypothetical protein